MGVVPTRTGSIRLDDQRSRRTRALRARAPRRRLRAAGPRDLRPPDGDGQPAHGPGLDARARATCRPSCSSCSRCWRRCATAAAATCPAASSSSSRSRARSRRGPRLLLLDEPTEGIQPSVIKDIGRVIRKLADRKTMAIVLVEQYYDFAAELADHYVVMERGEIVARGDGAAMAAGRRAGVDVGLNGALEIRCATRAAGRAAAPTRARASASRSPSSARTPARCAARARARPRPRPAARSRLRSRPAGAPRRSRGRLEQGFAADVGQRRAGREPQRAERALPGPAAGAVQQFAVVARGVRRVPASRGGRRP